MIKIKQYGDKVVAVLDKQILELKVSFEEAMDNIQEYQKILEKMKEREEWH